MSGLQALSEAGRRAVVRILAPAEPIMFVTALAPDEAARAAWPTAAAGALLALLGAPIAWMSGQAAWGAWQFGDTPVLPAILAVLAIPACLMGLYLMLAPRAAARRARDTIVLITDRRLVTLSVHSGRVQALPGRAILGVERTRVERGFGTLEIRHESAFTADGEAAETILSGLEDVMGAELAIRRLAQERALVAVETAP